MNRGFVTPTSRTKRYASGSRFPVHGSRSDPLAALTDEIRACRVCVDSPRGKPLAHEPRPVFQVSSTARIAVFSQAPGTRVHESGRPFTDASGVRLREWLGVGEDVFYDAARIAVVPMGFCFPGQDDKGGDLPPRNECAPLWRARLLELLPKLELMVLAGGYAQEWHLGDRVKGSLTETVAAWREFAPQYFPIPHPSWRNNGWLRRNPWFERELVPNLRNGIAKLL